MYSRNHSKFVKVSAFSTQQIGNYIHRKLTKYNYESHTKTKDEIIKFLLKHEEFKPLGDWLTGEDGKKQKLLSLVGSIPINYKGNEYGIPIQIWIGKDHPNEAPVVFVKPTFFMELNLVDCINTDGKVTLQFLSRWPGKHSCLEHLVWEIVKEFSENPPVYLKMERGVPTKAVLSEEMTSSNTGSETDSAIEAIRQEVLELKLRLDSQQNNQLSKTVCTVCRVDEVNTLAIPCGHIFCKRCLDRIRDDEGNDARCPLCRLNIQNLQNVQFP